ncbi:aminotransferase class V-fold PLP-dependent enzyme [Algisphaera agarilytica]|uniref:cysteine desulfurase n=1 Tax=Algisphaera agarilytica TaxID=1385975 RepID=A0A7X0H8A5_9BACT|nr:aminotransferase class V-fold PLP-dependent enzyme [Algisphaera agarilytica]MBB6430948.1 cysteine desulfurase family protein [Algisphaera agarilytica]
MIYLDNAATSFPKAPGVGEAAAAFIAKDAANPGRAGHRMAVAAEQMLDGVRLRLARLFNAPDFERMVFTMNGTDALNIAIKGVVSAKSAGGKVPHVITTVLEHNSVSRPLQALSDAGKITLTRVDCDDQGFVSPQDIKAAINDDTVLIAMTHASNVTGTIQDAAAVGAIAREADVLFLLDGAQTVGVVPVDVQAMQIDLLAFPGHKSLLGPTGTGALYVGERCPASSEDANDAERFPPFREGGTGGDSATPTQPSLFPYYLEGGTPNTVGIAGWSAGIDHVLNNPMAETLAHEQALCGKLIDAVKDDERFTVLGSHDPQARVGTVAINVVGMDAPDVGSILDDSFEIAVRPGLHCSPYVHQSFGTYPDGAVRVSPGAFTTEDEIDQLIEALDQIAM